MVVLEEGDYKVNEGRKKHRAPSNRETGREQQENKGKYPKEKGREEGFLLGQI